jgi:hypothetical protein
MAVEAEVERVADEERLLGGELVWWIVLLLLSLPVLLYGLTQAPTVGGFLLMTVGGILAGVSFTLIMVRLPYLIGRLIASFLIFIVVAAIFMGVAFVWSMSLPVPTPSQDTTFKPPISGG